MEAIGHAGTCLGILANDGVLLAAERRNIHKLLDEVFFSEKIYKLNEWVNWTAEGLFNTQCLSILTIKNLNHPFFSLYCCLKRVIIFFSDLACSVAGITSDANVLTNELRLIAQRWVSEEKLLSIINRQAVLKTWFRMWMFRHFTDFLFQMSKPVAVNVNIFTSSRRWTVNVAICYLKYLKNKVTFQSFYKKKEVQVLD